jgi:hypothetical protein
VSENIGVITDVGPIQRLEFPILPTGGVVVLRGANGVGKSTGVAGITAHLTGTGSLTRRDGSEEPGSVTAFGASIKIGNKTTRQGRPEVVALEGDISLATLVDPGIASVEAADRQRIKAAVRLSRTPASLSIFSAAINGYEAKLSPKAAAETDLVEMAALIKRDLQSSAKYSEDEAGKLEAAIKAANLNTQGVDLSSECDESTLRAAHTKAVQEESRLHAEARADAAAVEAYNKALDQAKAARESYTGPTVEESGKALDALLVTENALRSEANLIAGEIAQLQGELDAKNKAIEASEAKTTLARQSCEFAAQYAASIVDPEPPATTSPTTEQLNAATDAVAAASKAIEQGALIRAAKVHSEKIAAWKYDRSNHVDDAIALRNAARAVDAKLSECVASDALRVVEGRLLGIDARRGLLVPFAELSAGQRWIIALDLAIAAVGERGVLAIPQEAWDGIAPENRLLINAHCKRKCVTVYTAESTDGALRAETL